MGIGSLGMGCQGFLGYEGVEGLMVHWGLLGSVWSWGCGPRDVGSLRMLWSGQCGRFRGVEGLWGAGVQVV